MKPYLETKILRINPEWIEERLAAIIEAYENNNTFIGIPEIQKQHMIKMILETIQEAEHELHLRCLE